MATLRGERALAGSGIVTSRARARPSRTRRLLAGVAALAAAACVTAPAQGPRAGTAGEGADTVRRGGTLRIGLAGRGFPAIDPAIPVLGNASLWNATMLTLTAFPDTGPSAARRIVPAAAARLPSVSRDGRTYTFEIRRGLRLSNGEPVTAGSFRAQLERLLHPTVDSYVGHLLLDIVGARAYLEGRARAVTGVVAAGRRLTIRLTRPAPDLVVRLTMPETGAVPVGAPPSADGLGAPFHSAGPYYVRDWAPGRSALLARNPFWRRDLLPWRPAYVDRIAYTFGLTPDEILRRKERDELDLGSNPSSAFAELARRYGVNRERFFVAPSLTLWYLAFNHDRPLFRGNAPLRRAVNFALDRREIVRQFAPLTARRTDQLLPPAMPGYRDWDLYPLGAPNLRRALSLARGRLGGGRAVLYVISALTNPEAPRIGAVVRYNLARIGLDVEVRELDEAAFVDRVNRRDEPWDMALTGWVADYPDPANYVDLLFEGSRIRYDDPGGTNYARFDDPGFNRRIRAAGRLSGEPRLRAYAALDRDLLWNAAPIAPIAVQMRPTFTSASLGCYATLPDGSPNLVAMCKRRPG